MQWLVLYQWQSQTLRAGYARRPINSFLYLEITDGIGEPSKKVGFIVWPNMRDVVGGKDIKNKVSCYLANKGIVVIDLAKHYKNKDSNDLTVNSMDAHPNEMVNAEVAQLLYQTLAPWD